MYGPEWIPSRWMFQEKMDLKFETVCLDVTNNISDVTFALSWRGEV